MVVKKTPDQIRLTHRQDRHHRHLMAVHQALFSASFGDRPELYPREAPYRRVHSPGDPWWQQFNSRYLNKRELASKRGKHRSTLLVRCFPEDHGMSTRWRIIRRHKLAPVPGHPQPI